MQPIIQNNFFPKIVQKQIIDTITDNNFDWNYRKKENIKTRPEYKELYESDATILNGDGFRHMFYDNRKNYISKHGQRMMDLFSLHIEKNFNIKVNQFIRLISVFTLPTVTTKLYNLPHIDHFFEHKTLLYYVNSCDGDTFFFNETLPLNKYQNIAQVFTHDLEYKNRTIYKTITPEQGKAVLFDGIQYHAAGIPSLDNRYVINVNFI